MKRSLAAVIVMLALLPASVFAQREYITHLNYVPAGGQDAQTFFARLSPGDVDPTHPGYVFKHDGRGWYRELVGAPTPQPPSPPGPPPIENLPPVCLPWPNPYKEQARVIACNAALGPAFPPTKSVYRVGDHYARPYSSERIVVLSITRGIDEAAVITAQWLTNSPTYVDLAYKDPPHVAGDVFAFKPGTDDQWQSTSGPIVP